MPWTMSRSSLLGAFDVVSASSTSRAAAAPPSTVARAILSAMTACTSRCCAPSWTSRCRRRRVSSAVATTRAPGRGELRPVLRVGDRHGGAVRRTGARRSRQRRGSSVRCCSTQRRPDPTLDSDRDGCGRGDAGRSATSAERGVLVGVDVHGSAGAGHASDRRSRTERHVEADGRRAVAGGDDDSSAVVVEHQGDGEVTEQRRRLRRDGVEDLLGRRRRAPRARPPGAARPARRPGSLSSARAWLLPTAAATSWRTAPAGVRCSSGSGRAWRVAVTIPHTASATVTGTATAAARPYDAASTASGSSRVVVDADDRGTAQNAIGQRVALERDAVPHRCGAFVRRDDDEFTVRVELAQRRRPSAQQARGLRHHRGEDVRWWRRPRGQLGDAQERGPLVGQGPQLVHLRGGDLDHPGRRAGLLVAAHRRRSAVRQVGQDGPDAPVLGVGGRDAQLAEDRRHVLLDRRLADEQASAIPRLDLPSAIPASTAARGPSAGPPGRPVGGRASGRRPRDPARSRLPATLAMASTNEVTSPTRSLSR